MFLVRIEKHTFVVGSWEQEGASSITHLDYGGVCVLRICWQKHVWGLTLFGGGDLFCNSSIEYTWNTIDWGVYSHVHVCKHVKFSGEENTFIGGDCVGERKLSNIHCGVALSGVSGNWKENIASRLKTAKLKSVFLWGRLTRLSIVTSCLTIECITIVWKEVSTWKEG